MAVDASDFEKNLTEFIFALFPREGPISVFSFWGVGRVSYNAESTAKFF